MVTMKRNRKTKSNGDPAKAAAPVVNVSARSLDIQGAIRSYAYTLYERRGHQHGHDLEDWLRAESEVLPQIGT
jgi:hypothetical protein